MLEQQHTASLWKTVKLAFSSNIEDTETLKKVNAFVQAVADGEFLSPQAGIYGLREKLMRIGLSFGDVDTLGKSGTVTELK